MASTASVTYRDATPADLDAVRDVASATWAHDYPNVVNREAVTDTVESWYGRDELAADVRRGDALVLVADVDADESITEAADEPITEDANAAIDDAADASPNETGDIVGFVHGVVDGDRGSLLRAYVHPDARGHGLGRGVVEAALDAFRDRGCERAEAMVLAGNDPGNAFYRALGFEHVATDSTRVGGDSYDEHVYLRYL